jgi:S1-C subfamily serine protease
MENIAIIEEMTHLNQTLRSVLLASIIVLMSADGVSAAPEVQKVPVSSGTGFFVNPEFLVTNEHVVTGGCSQLVLLYHGAQWAFATIVATDAVHDLAILDSPRKHPLSTAHLRANIEDLKAGDKLVVMGYPVESMASGHYELADAKVLNPHESLGNAALMQYSGITKQGFSGGPLLDENGNVVGVVKGMVKMYKTEVVNGAAGQPQLDQQFDEAVTLGILKGFLRVHGIPYNAIDSDAVLDDAHIESIARDFIVNVQCLH